jgi:hypothetical protein
MVKFEGLLLVISLALTFYTFVDCAMRDETEIQKLPKWGWLLLILLFGLASSITYLVIGRGTKNGSPRNSMKKRNQPKKIKGPDDDPDFLRSL